MTYPILDDTERGYVIVSCENFPTNSASTKQSTSYFRDLGVKDIPCEIHPDKYRARFLTACSCINWGLFQCRANIWTAYAISGCLI